MAGTSPAMTWQSSSTDKKSRLRKRRGRVNKNPDCDSESFEWHAVLPPEEVQGQNGRDKARQGAKPARASRARAPQGPMGLHLRRRQGAGPLRHEGPARRQGRQPRRDGEPRPAGAAGLHHHHRGLHALLRQRAEISEGPGEAGRRRPRPHRAHHRPAVRRPRQSAARLGALRRARLDAGHDGHRAQPRPQRRDRRGAGAAVRRPPLRL